MATIVFKYVNGLTYSRTFTVIKLRGLDEPDHVEFWPNFQHTMADGSVIENIKGFRRIVTVTCGVLNDSADRQFFLNFLQHTQRAITYSAVATTDYSLMDVGGFENQWLYDTKLMRFFEVTLRENSIYTTWPAFVEPTPDSLMYIKGGTNHTKIEVTGTEASPQTFTTNTAPLDTDDTGAAYPSISLVAYAPTILITEYQDSLVNRVGDITQSGANISFQLAHSDVGNPFSDGKWYVSLAIGLQAK